MKTIKYEIGNNKVVQIQYGSEATLLDVDTIISSWKNAVSFYVQDDNSPGFRPAQLGALFSIKSHWIVSNEPATVVMPTGERVIIVMGALNALESKVSGTLNRYISRIT